MVDTYKLAMVNIEKKHIYPSNRQGWPIQHQYIISEGLCPFPQKFWIPSTFQNPSGSPILNRDILSQYGDFTQHRHTPC